MLQIYDLILFDLDGTISDPLEGIGRSINYALGHYGYEPRELSEMARYVGPPLDETFKQITGNEADAEALVAKYRERYGAIGYAENVLYPGIKDVLLALDTANIAMGLCTLKRQDFAEQILELFGIAHYFQFVSGGEVGIPKYQQIEQLRSQGKISPSTLMIGDRAADMIAAHKNGLDAGAALWGYGSQSELLNEAPRYGFTSPQELIQLVPQG